MDALPQALLFLGIIPSLYHISILAGHVWMFVAMVTAVKKIMNYDTRWQAVKVCIIGWLLMLEAAFVLGSTIKGIGF